MHAYSLKKRQCEIFNYFGRIIDSYGFKPILGLFHNELPLIFIVAIDLLEDVPGEQSCIYGLVVCY